MDTPRDIDILLAYVNALLADPDTAALDVDALTPMSHDLGERLSYLGKCVQEGRHLADSLTAGDFSMVGEGNTLADNPLVPSIATIKKNLSRSIEMAQHSLALGFMAGTDGDANSNDYTRVLERTVTDLLEQQDSLVKTAFTDMLTGLGNRGGYVKSLDELWEQGDPVTMAFIDIDNLKHCNDNYGHEEGNRYILQVSLYLKLYTQHDEAIFRIGGDEFAVLSTSATEEDLAARLERCRDLLIKNNGSEMPHTFSFGVASADPKAGDTSKQMTIDADHRMYDYKLRHAVHLERRDAARTEAEDFRLTKQVFDAFSMLDEGRYFYINNLDRGRTLWSQGAVRDLDLPSERIDNPIEYWKTHVHPDDLAAYTAEIDQIIDGTKHRHSMQYRVKNAAGDYVLCRSRGFRIDGVDGEPTLFVGEIVNHAMAETIDFATGLGAQRMLLNAIDTYRRDHVRCGLVAVRVRGTAALNESYGYEPIDGMLAEYAGRMVSVARGRARVFRSRNAQFVVLAGDLSREAFEQLVEELRHAMGAPVTVEGDALSPTCLVVPVYYDRIASQAASVVGELDRRLRVAGGLVPNSGTLPVPEIERKSAANEHLDSLTGLYRPSEFLRRANRFLDAADGGTWCIATIDMGHMRLYNEWYGQEAGDLMLAEVGTVLKDIESSGDGVAGYWGQDDFCVLVPFERAKVERVFEGVRRVVAAHDDAIGFMPSMGVYPIDADDEITIDSQAKAMFANRNAKHDFKNRIAIFSPAEYEREVEFHNVLTEFQYALKAGQISYYLQPQVDVKTGAIIGAEALTRWTAKDGQLISPASFIPALEESGFVVTLDKYVWQNVATWLRDRLDKGLPVVPVSINVSRVDILTSDVAAHLSSVAQMYNLPPELIRVEITETAYTGETKAVGELTAELHRRGFTTHMDDFGSGQSSLGMLKNVNVDVIKLDRSFVPENAQSTRTSQIMASMLEMTHSLGLPVVVEGIETEEQAELLRKMGGEYAQGFYFYRPMPVSDFEKLLDGGETAFSGAIKRKEA